MTSLSRRGRVLSTLLAVPLLAGAGLTAVPDGLPEIGQVEPDRSALEDGYNHLVVGLRTDDLGETVEDLRARLAARPGVVDVRPVSPDTVSVTAELTAREVFAFPEVGSVRHDTVVDVGAAPADAAFGSQWPLRNTGTNIPGMAATPGADVDALSAWETTQGGGVVVAVIDSAIALDHPDLAGRIWRNTDEVCGNGKDDDRNGYVDDCQGWDFTDGDARTYDPAQGHGTALHGTHVAGTIAASANEIGVRGVAPGATIMPLTALLDGSGWTSWSTAAIRYAVDNGADVINMSLGGRSADPAQKAALDHAASRGVLVVAAAGNSGSDNDTTPHYPAASPSESVIAVASTDARDRLSSFSNYGATSVDLAAPGSAVLSTVPGGGYGYLQGTSMATPHVTGAAALLLAADPDLTLPELRAALLDSTDELPALAGRVVSGGRLDVGRAVDRVQPAVAFTVSGLDSARPGVPVAASVRAVAAPAALPAGRDLAYRATLGALVDGEVYAVTQQPVVAAGRAAATDAAGAVPLSDPFTPASRPGLTADGDVVALSTTLPEGQYALALELVDAADPATVVGRPAVVHFAVTEPAPAPVPAPVASPAVEGPAPAAPPAVGSPGPGTPGTPGAPGSPEPAPEAPGGTTTPAPGSPAPGSPAPGTPAPGTTAPAPGDATTSPAPGGGTTSPAPGTRPAPAPGTTPAPAPGPGGGTAPAPAPAPGAPGAPSPGTTTSGPGTAPAPAPVPAAPAPAPAPVHTIPGGTPLFGITSISPARGSTAGRDLVTLTGTRLPAQARVLIGGTVADVVFRSGTTSLTVRTPARAAGAVDVRVFATNGTSDVVVGGYTYVSPAGTPAPPTTTSPAPVGSAPAPAPAAPAPAPTSPAPAPSPAAPAPAPAPQPVVGPQPRMLGTAVLARPAAGSALARVDPSSWSAQTCHATSCPAFSV